MKKFIVMVALVFLGGCSTAGSIAGLSSIPAGGSTDTALFKIGSALSVLDTLTGTPKKRAGILSFDFNGDRCYASVVVNGDEIQWNEDNIKCRNIKLKTKNVSIYRGSVYFVVNGKVYTSKAELWTF